MFHMKVLLILTTILLLFVDCSAQPKPTNESEYNSKFDYAVSATNRAFPFVFTVEVERFSGGKSWFTENTINERQAPGVERINRTTVNRGQTSVSYQVKTGLGQVYCSTDGKEWTGPQKFECPSSTTIYGPREPESSEYSVEGKVVGGQAVKVYRERLIYSAAPGKQNKPFKETLATIDSRGFFISVTNKEGSLAPEEVSLTRKQTWDFKTKMSPVTAPK
jgi:hypothetical protein